MIETKTFRFRKPEGHDICNIGDQNVNWDKIENILKCQRRQIWLLSSVMMIFLIGKIGEVHLQQLLNEELLNFLRKHFDKFCRKLQQHE